MHAHFANETRQDGLRRRGGGGVGDEGEDGDEQKWCRKEGEW